MKSYDCVATVRLYRRKTPKKGEAEAIVKVWSYDWISSISSNETMTKANRKEMIKKAKPCDVLPDSRTDPNSEDYIYWGKDIEAERLSILEEVERIIDIDSYQGRWEAYKSFAGWLRENGE